MRAAVITTLLTWCMSPAAGRALGKRASSNSTPVNATEIGQLNTTIATTAGGSIPNNTTPIKLNTVQAVSSVQLLTWLEQLEVALYYEGYENITSGQWNLSNAPNDTANIILKTAAQEDVHVATLEALLSANSDPIPSPCKYSFPCSSLTDFFALANLITPANYGSILGVQNLLASTTPNIVFSSSAILATEVRHEVFLRFTAGEIPNPAPFDTGIPPEWGYNIALAYVVPGTCALSPAFATYPRLYRAGRPMPGFASAETQNLTKIELEWELGQFWETELTGNNETLYVSWLDRINDPVQTVLNVTGPGRGETEVPVGMVNTAYAAITREKVGNLVDLAAATLAGPLAVPIS